MLRFYSDELLAVQDRAHEMHEMREKLLVRGDWTPNHSKCRGRECTQNASWNSRNGWNRFLYADSSAVHRLCGLCDSEFQTSVQKRFGQPLPCFLRFPSTNRISSVKSAITNSRSSEVSKITCVTASFTRGSVKSRRASSSNKVDFSNVLASSSLQRAIQFTH